MFSDRKLSNFRNVQSGKACYVCGLGPSLSLLTEEYRTVPTIGMEDIGLYFTPDYLTAIHTLEPQMLERAGKEDISNQKQIEDILSTQCQNVFATYDLPFRHVKPIEAPRMMLNKYPLEEIFANDHLAQWKMGFMITISLALYMGFKYIGLIGIDFTGDRIVNTEMDVVHRTFDNEKFWKDMDFGFTTLLKYAGNHEINIYNLSPISVVNHFERVEIGDFYQKFRGLK